MPIPSSSVGGFRKRLKLHSGSSPPPKPQGAGAVGGAGPPLLDGTPDASAEAEPATHSSPSPSPPRHQPTFPCNLTALENIGNTCFLNVVLQVLRYTPGFVDKLSALAAAVNCAVQAQAASRPASDYSDDVDIAATWRFVSSLQKLYDEMSERELLWQSSPGVRGVQAASPEYLLTVLRELNPMFEGKEQHDAHELLRCIQCYLQDAANLVNNADNLTVTVDDAASADHSVVPCAELAVGPALFQQHGDMCSATGDRCSATGDRCSATGDRCSATSDRCSATGGCCSCSAAIVAASCPVPFDGSALPSTTNDSQEADEPLLPMPLRGGGRLFVDPRLTSTASSEQPRSNQPPWCSARDRVAALDSPTSAASCSKQVLVSSAGDRSAEASSEVAPLPLAAVEAAVFSLSDVQLGQHMIPSCMKQQTVDGSSDGGKCSRYSTMHGTNELAFGLHSSPKRARLSDGVASPVDDTLTEPSQASCHSLAAESHGSMRQTTITSLFLKKIALQQPGSPTISAPFNVLREEKNADSGAEPAGADAFPECRSSASTADVEFADATEMPVAPSGTSVAKTVQPPVPDIMDRLFHGLVTIRTRCLECESSKVRGDVFADIIVPVRRAARPGAATEAASSGSSSERASDDDGYDSDAGSHCSSSSDGESCATDSTVIAKAFCEREFLQGENKYYCEDCMRHTEADISTRYSNLPPILTVHLKRFAATYGAGYSMLQKLSDHVPTPLELPCAICRTEEQPCTIDSHRYFLYAIIVHVGSTLDLGHYVCHVRVAEELQTGEAEARGPGERRCDERLAWVTLDDDSAAVSTSAVDSVDMLLGTTGSRATPYLLFYCRGDTGRCFDNVTANSSVHCSGAAHSLSTVRRELLLPQTEQQPDRDLD